MTLDSFVDPARAPLSDSIRSLMQALLRELGTGWTWDDTHMEGARIRDGEITLRLEDLGHGLLAVEAVMPGRFIPAPGFTRLFSVGAEEIARQITEETLPAYRHVAAHSDQHQDDEDRWERDTEALLTQLCETLGMPANIEVGHDPGLNMSVLLQRAVGDSLRITAQPGAGPSVVMYTRTLPQLWPISEAWSKLAPERAVRDGA